MHCVVRVHSRTKARMRLDACGQNGTETVQIVCQEWKPTAVPCDGTRRRMHACVEQPPHHQQHSVASQAAANTHIAESPDTKSPRELLEEVRSALEQTEHPSRSSFSKVTGRHSAIASKPSYYHGNQVVGARGTHAISNHTESMARRIGIPRNSNYGSVRTSSPCPLNTAAHGRRTVSQAARAHIQQPQ